MIYYPSTEMQGVTTTPREYGSSELLNLPPPRPKVRQREIGFGDPSSFVVSHYLTIYFDKKNTLHDLPQTHTRRLSGKFNFCPDRPDWKNGTNAAFWPIRDQLFRCIISAASYCARVLQFPCSACGRPNEIACTRWINPSTLCQVDRHNKW